TPFAAECLEIFFELPENFGIFLAGHTFPISPQAEVEEIGGRIKQENTDGLDPTLRQVRQEKEVLSRFGSVGSEAQDPGGHLQTSLSRGRSPEGIAKAQGDSTKASRRNSLCGPERARSPDPRPLSDFDRLCSSRYRRCSG